MPRPIKGFWPAILLLLCSTIVANAQRITRVTPSAGGTGDVVLVEGTNISSVNIVRFGTTVATFWRVDNTRLYAIVPTGYTSGDVEIIGGAGADNVPFFGVSATCANGYTGSCVATQINSVAIGGTAIRYDSLARPRVRCGTSISGSAHQYKILPSLAPWYDTLRGGVNYTLSVNVGTGKTAVAWMDWDRSGTYEIGEYMLLGQNTSGTAQTLTSNFTVPDTAFGGMTRILVKVVPSTLNFNFASSACSQVLNQEDEVVGFNVFVTLPDGLPGNYCGVNQLTSCTQFAINTLRISGDSTMEQVFTGCPGSGRAGRKTIPRFGPNGRTYSFNRYAQYTITLNVAAGAGWNAFIDYDQDGSFSADELLDDVITPLGNNTIAVRFTIPASASLGYTRLRIVTLKTVGAITGCITGGTSYILDYGVLINPEQPNYCPVVHSNSCDPAAIITSLSSDRSSFNYTASTCPTGGAAYLDLVNSSLGSHLFTATDMEQTLTVRTNASGVFAFWVDYNLNGLFEEAEGRATLINANTPAILEIYPNDNLRRGTGLARVRFFPGRTAVGNSLREACRGFNEGQTIDFSTRFNSRVHTGLCVTPPNNGGCFSNGYLTNININNTPLTFSQTRCQDDYQDLRGFGNPDYNAELDRGTNYVIRAVTSFSDTKVAAFIDWNGDGQFSASEYIPMTVSNFWNWQGTINIPATAVSGWVTLRVRTAEPNETLDANSGCRYIHDGTTYEFMVRIKPLCVPVPTITASSSTINLCPGESAVLSGPPASAWLWSNGATTQNITVTTAGSYTLRVVAGSCTSSASAAVQVNLLTKPATPTVNATNGGVVCGTANVVLSSSITGAGVRYRWSNGDTTATITVTRAGRFKLAIMNAAGCLGDSSIAVNVTVGARTATPTITASGPLSFCQGGSVTLSLPAGMAEYRWSNGENTRSIVVNYPGNFIGQVRATGECLSITSAPVTVSLQSGGAALRPTVIGNTALCTGDSVTLASPTTYDRYLWSTGATTRSIVVKQTGTYWLRAANGTNCFTDTSAANFVQVTVGAMPVPVPVSVNGNTTICQGDSVQLSAPLGYSRYLWSNGATTRSIFVKAGGRYTVRVAQGGCLSDTLSGFKQDGLIVGPAGAGAQDSIYLILDTRNTCPTQAANAAQSMQGATTVRLHSGVTLGANAWSNVVSTTDVPTEPRTRFTLINGQWVKRIKVADYYGLTPAQTPTAMNLVVNGDAPTGGWFAREGKQIAGCGDFLVPFPISRTASPATYGVTVSVSTAPNRPVVSGPDTVRVCQGTPVQLSISNPQPNASYLWSNGATTNNIVVTSAGTYTVRARVGNCNSVPSVNKVVVVNALPPNPSGATTVINPCVGDSSIITYAIPGGYRWNTGEFGNRIIIQHTNTVPTKVWVNRISPQGCLSAGADTFTITAANPPVVTITYRNDSLIATGGGTYRWYLNGVLVPGVTTSRFKPTVSGDYFARVNVLSCSTDTRTISVLVGLPNARVAGYDLFPNPATNTCTIAVPTHGTYNLRVFNALGKLVHEGNREAESMAGHDAALQLDLSSLAAGHYQVMLSNGRQTVPLKLVVRK